MAQTKPEYVGLLNDIRMGEYGAGDFLRAWADKTPDSGLKGCLTLVAARETSHEEINKLMKEAAEGSLKGVLAYNDKPLVSIDFNHDPASSSYDASLTKVIEGTLVKVVAWYDNEWGFSNRMLDTTSALMNAS